MRGGRSFNPTPDKPSIDEFTDEGNFFSYAVVIPLPADFYTIQLTRLRAGELTIWNNSDTPENNTGDFATGPHISGDRWVVTLRSWLAGEPSAPATLHFTTP